jgi:hypothetical protein
MRLVFALKNVKDDTGESGKSLERTVVAHGHGSDSNGDGMAESFGDIPDSNKTSLGEYMRPAAGKTE